jgi:hypothetical protein
MFDVHLNVELPEEIHLSDPLGGTAGVRQLLDVCGDVFSTADEKSSEASTSCCFWLRPLIDLVQG